MTDIERELRETMRDRASQLVRTPLATRALIRRARRRRAGTVAVAGALLMAVTFGGVTLGRSLLVEGTIEPADRPQTPSTAGPGQMEIVRQVVDAINAREADSLASSFIDAGTFEPYARWGGAPLAEVIPTWMGNIESWGLEAQVRPCERRAESVVRCDVHTLWHTLQMEMGERWRFEFENGQLKSLVMVRSDLDPADRLLPLGYTDLDRWESWLEENHPEQAAVLLSTGAPLIVSFLRYDGTYAEEIEASIREYLDSW